MIHGLVLFGVVAILAAIAIPNFVKARTGRPPPCIAYLMQIDSATQQWALENKKKDTDVPVQAEVAKFLLKGVIPKCSQGGIYRLGATVGDAPTCSLAATLGHSLPELPRRSYAE